MSMKLEFCIDKKCNFLIKDEKGSFGYICEFHTEKCPMEYECSYINILEEEEIKFQDVVMEIDTSVVGKVLEVSDIDGTFIVDYKGVKSGVKYLAEDRNKFEIILRRVQ